MSNLNIVRLLVLAFLWLWFCCVPFALGQERPEAPLESERETAVTDFYQRQKMDEDLRALRGDLEQIKRRLTNLDDAQQLIQELALKVSTIQGQIQKGDSSLTTLNEAFEGFKGDINQLASKVDLLDSDIRRNLEVLVEGLSPPLAEGDQPPRATKDIKPLEISIDSAPPPLSDENDVKAFYEYAYDLYKKGSYKEAINLFYALNEKFPDNQYAKSGMYWAAIGLNKEPGQSQQALTVLTQLLPRLKNHNKHCAAMLEAGIIHVERGECSAAGKYLIEAEKICSSDQEATNQMLAQTRRAELKRRCAP